MNKKVLLLGELGDCFNFVFFYLCCIILLLSVKFCAFGLKTFCINTGGWYIKTIIETVCIQLY